MKKIFQMVLVYLIGILCVFCFIWRASCLDNSSNSLASNYSNNQETINY